MPFSPPPGTDRPRVIGVLGPTNTGKTHLAMERMLGHPSGMIGFPLRLLARENYDRACRAAPPSEVALITGEEKIVPPRARYFLCTVESMPVDRPVAFVGIDEIQLCADADRGHVFTDRLLHARGGVETMFMGAETIRPLLRRLVPGVETESRPRFSTLSHVGATKLSRLPPRSAVVAFSLSEVYALAEWIRRQRGGAAIVLGALSPRTRNAQVAMYQAGEVDYLVATDAIGMGLNMHVDHVAFAGTRKFDGRTLRPLAPAELAQIAGRAGRYTRNGSFGTTADITPFDPEIAERIENHRFDTLAQLQWRNSELSFVSLAALRASLARLPGRAGLVRARQADDETVLDVLGREPDITASADGPERVRLLWDVCQIPDFGKVAGEGHARLLSQIYRHLAGLGGTSSGRLPTDWVAQQVDRINRSDGDIETLMQRIANIRIWTYVAHRADWLTSAGEWQERTRAIEDKLSDALHERLVRRFVDRRTASLVGRIKERQDLIAAVTGDGCVVVEGHHVGLFEGFRYLPDAAVRGHGPAGNAGRAVHAAVQRALRGEVIVRLNALEAETTAAISLRPDGRLCWRDTPIARLVAGADALHPRIEPLGSDLLDPGQRQRIRVALGAWLHQHLATALAPLLSAAPEDLGGPARGLIYQLAEGLGALSRARAAAQLAALDDRERMTLVKLGLSFGARSVYVRALLKPAAVALRALLWSVAHGQPPLSPPQPGRTSVPAERNVPAAFYDACGFTVLGPRAVRVDVAERMLAEAYRRSRRAAAPTAGPIERTFASWLGCATEEVRPVIAALGVRLQAADGGDAVVAIDGRRHDGNGRAPRWQAKPVDQDRNSPFAKLKALPASR
jgi:ATP-dependent RNA helicase SUPV3L1/SUV3